MADQIDVSPHALSEHASAVANFMSELQAATDNASDTWDLRAFGMACMIEAQILQLWTTTAFDHAGGRRSVRATRGDDPSQA